MLLFSILNMLFEPHMAPQIMTPSPRDWATSPHRCHRMNTVAGWGGWGQVHVHQDGSPSSTFLCTFQQLGCWRSRKKACNAISKHSSGSGIHLWWQNSHTNTLCTKVSCLMFVSLFFIKWYIKSIKVAQVQKKLQNNAYKSTMDYLWQFCLASILMILYQHPKCSTPAYFSSSSPAWLQFLR